MFFFHLLLLSRRSAFLFPSLLLVNFSFLLFSFFVFLTLPFFGRFLFLFFFVFSVLFWSVARLYLICRIDALIFLRLFILFFSLVLSSYCLFPFCSLVLSFRFL